MLPSKRVVAVLPPGVPKSVEAQTPWFLLVWPKAQRNWESPATMALAAVAVKESDTLSPTVACRGQYAETYYLGNVVCQTLAFGLTCATGCSPK